MLKKNVRVLLTVSMLILVILVAGCGGSSGVKRVAGLSTTETVTTFLTQLRITVCQKLVYMYQMLLRMILKPC